jgi:hypothetical protein
VDISLFCPVPPIDLPMIQISGDACPFPSPIACDQS